MELTQLEGEEKTTIMVAGEEVKVNPGDPVGVTLKKILTDKGIDSFTILVNGEEITSTESLPATFGDAVISVERYVKPGRS